MDGTAARPTPPADGAVPGDKPVFSYEEAFSRNLGWLTEWEQQSLRHKRVAIAGMGGVGGVHLMTLARFGIGAFTIADPDHFELANFNRQVGATLDTIGRLKVEVLAENARKINPELDITCFDRGVEEQTIDAFLAGVDLYIDALDFFVLDIRRKLTDRCGALGIPVVNAAPIGMGTAFLVFQPGGMSFEEWFRIDGLTEEQQYVSYLLGMAPSGLHRRYLADPSRVDLRGRRGPSTPAACELCAGVAAVEAVKLLLGRGPVKAVPYYHHFDAYRGRWVTKKMRGGNANPLQRLKIAITRRLAAKLSRQSAALPTTAAPVTELEKILDIARWSPSGDNTQPWRFELLDDERVIIHLRDQSDHDPYDYRGGEPTLLSGGMLLESLRIAASAFARGCDWRYDGRQGHLHRLTVHLPKLPGISPDPLLGQIHARSVDRRPYRRAALTEMQKAALTAALGDACTISWHEPLAARWRFAKLGGQATKIRLDTPETFAVHQDILDWTRQQSPTGIPAAAAGISPLSRGAMRWGMQSWGRMRLLNGLGGRWAGAVQMDYLPGACSAAFFTIGLKDGAPADAERPMRLLAAGGAIQRFWLTATRLGLALQPNLATLIFADYGDSGTSFTTAAAATRRAATLARVFRKELGIAPGTLVFIGRIGTPRPRNFARSARRPLHELMAPPISSAAE